MDLIDIYIGDDVYVTVKPDESSVQSKTIMGENTLKLVFRLNHYVAFDVNHYCTVYGEKYILNRLPDVQKESSRKYTYTLLMEAEGSQLIRAQYLFLGPDNLLTETDFALMGNAETFIDLILSNINRCVLGFSKGSIIATEYKNITFSKDNCLSALTRIAEEFETEYWIIGKTINLFPKKRDTGYVFSQGRFKGLYELTRLSINVNGLITRLYVYGADKNLPTTYGASRLHLPDAAGPTAVKYLEKFTAEYGVIEGTQIFDDVYPHRTGTVSAVDAGNIYIFSDADIDFDVNDQLLPGLEAKLTFNTGQLAGYTFRIAKFDNGLKQFTIVKNDEEKALEIPNSLIKPAIGDKYVLTDILMPDTYVSIAEASLQLKALQLLDIVSLPQVTYSFVLDPTYVRGKGLIIGIGDLLWLVDDPMQINRSIRVISLTRGILNEDQYTLTLGDQVQPSTIPRIEGGVIANDRALGDLQSVVDNRGVFNNRVVGAFRMEQLPETATMTGFSELVIEDATSIVYKKV